SLDELSMSPQAPAQTNRKALGTRLVERRDAVVQKEAARTQRAKGRTEVLLDSLGAHVLDHANTGNTVEGGLAREIAIVAHLDPALVGEPCRGDASASQLSLRFAERDAERRDSILLDGVEYEAAPSAADVEKTIAGSESQLSADVVELGLLRVVE